MRITYLLFAYNCDDTPAGAHNVTAIRFSLEDAKAAFYGSTDTMEIAAIDEHGTFSVVLEGFCESNTASKPVVWRAPRIATAALRAKLAEVKECGTVLDSGPHRAEIDAVLGRVEALNERMEREVKRTVPDDSGPCGYDTVEDLKAVLCCYRGIVRGNGKHESYLRGGDYYKGFDYYCRNCGAWVKKAATE